MTIGTIIGRGFAIARDAIARGLIRLGVTPNMLTLVGMVITGAAGVCFAVGATDRFAWTLDPYARANAWLLMAAGLIILASAADMLDGAVARLGNQASQFGAMLDSSLDRYSDFAVYAGMGVAYAWAGNATFAFLASLAFFNAFMISYTRARAEDLIESCKVGYWQRGERSGAILIATFAYNIPALLVQQAILPMLTAIRRIGYTANVLADREPITDPRKGGWWLKLRLWRWPRGTWAYDVVTGANILWLIAARFEPLDVLRIWLGR